jgi:hypothetical protein
LRTPRQHASTKSWIFTASRESAPPPDITSATSDGYDARPRVR